MQVRDLSVHNSSCTGYEQSKLNTGAEHNNSWSGYEQCRSGTYLSIIAVVQVMSKAN